MRPSIARHRSAIVVLVVSTLLNAGCAAGQKIRFQEPEGAGLWAHSPGEFELRNMAFWLEDEKLPLERSLPLGESWLRITLEDGTSIHGRLVVLRVLEEEAEFRIGAQAVRDAARGGYPAYASWRADNGEMVFHFKGTGEGIASDDPEVADWRRLIVAGSPGGPSAGIAIFGIVFVVLLVVGVGAIVVAVGSIGP